MKNDTPTSARRASLSGLARVAALALLCPALLAACAPKVEPPAPVVQAPEPTPAPPVAEAPPPALPPVQLAWTFAMAGEACQARAAGATASLLLLVRKNQPVSLVLAGTRRRPLRAGAVTVSFRGAAGDWQARGRASRHAVTVAMRLDDRALGQVLALLGGGTIEAGGNRAGLPPLQLLPAGDPGRTWFDCAKGKLLG